MSIAWLLTAALAATAVHGHFIKKTACPDGKNSAFNPQCCKWFGLRDSLIDTVFDGVCGENAHSTVRIAFHDAIGFSKNGGMGNGADGSIIAFPEELEFDANAGIDDIVGDLKPFADQNGISYGDVIQFGSSVALSLCPGAPLVPTFVGRPNATIAAPDGTVPKPFDSVTDILARMKDGGFSPAELIALLSSHSIAAQDEIQTTIHGSPFDSTPGSFDSQIFLEVLLKGTQLPGGLPLNQGEVQSPLDGEFRLQSDFNLARDPRTACQWQSFVGSQKLMAIEFAVVMAKLGLTGQNIHELTDCTEVIQLAPPATASAAIFPPGTSHKDLELSCNALPFPKLKTAIGTATAILPVPTQ